MKRVSKLVVCFGLVCGWAMSATAQDLINTVVGGGPDGIPGADSNLDTPGAVAIDATDNVYVAAEGQNRVFKISPAGIMTVVAGNGFEGYSGDGGAAGKAMLNLPQGVAVDAATPLPNVYISDTANCLVRKVNQNTGVITTIAGVVTMGSPVCGYSGNGSAANEAQLDAPMGMSLDTKTGDLYVADNGNGVIRKIAGGIPTGTISVVAGGGGSATAENNCGGSAPYGDAGTATSGYLCSPQSVTVDSSASPVNLFISEYKRLQLCDVREVVGSTAKIYQVAGSYSQGCGFADNVAATSSELDYPSQTHVSVNGATTTVQVTDYINARIRQFTLTYAAGVPVPGNMTTIAGGGGLDFCADNVSALGACMGPIGIVYDSSGNYYIGDSSGDRVRKVTQSTMRITSIAGWGIPYLMNGFKPEYSLPVGIFNSTGTPALSSPQGVYADPKSNDVYVAGGNGNSAYVWNSSTDKFSDFAGNGTAGEAGDGLAASNGNTEVSNPLSITKDGIGNVYVGDFFSCVIRKVDVTGIISTYAGTGVCGNTGNRGPATSAEFGYPTGLAADAEGNLYVSDNLFSGLREVSAGTMTVTEIVGGAALGAGFTGDGGPASLAKLHYPGGISLDGTGNIYIADTANNRIRKIDAGTRIIHTVAGNGMGAYTGDGSATGNALNQPNSVFADVNGNLFVADQDSHLLRWVTPSGTMITYAGTVPTTNGKSSAGFSGDGGPALQAQLYYPAGISRDSSGNTYVADNYNDRIRQVTPFAGYGLSTVNLTFGTQAVGSKSIPQSILLSAVGPTMIDSIAVAAPFSETDDCAGVSLTAGQTCRINVYFQPTTTAQVTRSLTIQSNAFFALNPSSITLSGPDKGATSTLSLSGSLAFGTESLKVASPKTVTLTNSGATAVTLERIYVTETTDFSIHGGTCPIGVGALAANSSCTILVNFTPQTAGSKIGNLKVESSDPASPLLSAMTGSGTEVRTSLSSIDYGTISFGRPSTTYLTITNAGSVAFTLTPSIINTEFSISSSGNTCGSSLAGGAKCQLPVIYNPTAVGSNTGSLTLTTNGGSSPVIPLSGSAVTDVSVSATSIAFGTIPHATTKVVSLTVSNSGQIDSMTVNAAVSGAGAADFTILATGNTCESPLKPGASCTLPVQFKPVAAASYAATLSVTTNGGSNPMVALTGMGN